MSARENLNSWDAEHLTVDYVQVAVVENSFNGVYRDPSTGRFVSRHAVDPRGWTKVVRPLVQVEAVDEANAWVNCADGYSHAHLACRSLGEVTSTGALAGWSCSDCTGVEQFPWEMVSREDHSGGLGGTVAAAVLAAAAVLGPCTAKVLADKVNCSLGRVYEVARAGGLRKVGRGVFAV